MNFASWIILAVVLVVVGLAVRATFFTKKKGGCCDTGDEPATCQAKGCEGCSAANCHAADMQARIREVSVKLDS